MVRRFNADARTTTLWRIASHQSAKIGDRVYLFKQGSGARGIFGVGGIIEQPRLQNDPTDIDADERWRARIGFDRLVDPRQEFLIALDEVADILPETLLNAQSSGIAVPDDFAFELEKRLPPLAVALSAIKSDQADDLAFDPDSVNDERERAVRAIRLRRGQPAFRAALLIAYERRCVITACSVEDVLEEAHITPYLGDLTNHVSNGLLLRTDLHTLFDCGLLAIEPKTRTIVISDGLKRSSYVNLAGRQLRRPKDPASAPSRRNLEKRFALFSATRGR